MVVVRKEVNISLGKVCLKRLSYGDVRTSLRKALGKGGLDVVLQADHQLLLSIESAPFEKTLEELYKLDWQDGEKLKNAFNALNRLNEDQKKGLGDSSGATRESSKMKN